MVSSSDDNPVLEPVAWQSFVELWNDDGPKALIDLLREYLEDADHYLARIEDALKTNEPAMLESAVHTLKSSSANLGANRVESLCRTMEAQARRRELEPARCELSSLVAAMDATRRRLEEEIDRLAAQPDA